MSAGGTYLDAKYKSFPAAAVLSPNPGGGNTTVPFDASGEPLIRAPEFSGNAMINFETYTGAGLFSAYVSGHYNSGYRYDPSGSVGQPEYATIDAEVAFSPGALEGLRIAVYGRNLTDKTHYAGFFTSDFGSGGLLSPPRTYGVRLEYSF